MSRLLAFLLVVQAACSVATRSAPPADHGVAYVNGQWFDGTGFHRKTMYVANGVFVSTAPVTIDSTVDLAGGFVVPPFADAHQHLSGPPIEMAVAAYMRDGIFYVKDQANAPAGRRMIDHALNRP